MHSWVVGVQTYLLELEHLEVPVQRRECERGNPASVASLVRVILRAQRVRVGAGPEHQGNPLQVPLLAVVAQGDVGLLWKARKPVPVALEDAQGGLDAVAQRIGQRVAL